MSKAATTNTPATPETAAAHDAAPSLREVWQVPALVVAAALLGTAAIRSLSLTPKVDFDLPLKAAESLIEANKPDAAIAKLNADVFPYYTKKKLSLDQKAEFHTLMGRAIFLGQKSKEINREDNNKNVERSYLEAETLGKKLEPQDQGFLAEAMIDLGELEQAHKRASKLPEKLRDRRTELLEKIVDSALGLAKGGEGEHELSDDEASKRHRLAVSVISDVLTDPETDTATRAWALARQARVQIERGEQEAAINRLVREIPKLVDVEPEVMGQLYLLLARAYFESRDVAGMRRQVDRASELVTGGKDLDELRYLQAKTEELASNRSLARERYEALVADALEARWKLPGLLGVAETSSGLGDYEGAAKAFSELVEELKQGERSKEVTPARVAESIVARARDRLDGGDTAMALRFAALTESLLDKKAVPPEAALVLARAHRRTADEIVESVTRGKPEVAKIAELDESTRSQVKAHLLAAGQYFREHADRVVLIDTAAYADSLWNAADSFDRAGDQDQAVMLFKQYAQERAGDPRRGEATFRLAQVYQARGEFETAEELYRTLIEMDKQAGQYADLAYVPLAQTLLADSKPENDEEAERLLEKIAHGAVSGPGSATFKAAVFELADYSYSKGEIERAIERFDEVIKRYPGDSRVPMVRYKLADALRQSAVKIEKDLEGGTPEEKRRMEAVRAERLSRSLSYFEQVKREMEAKDPRRRTAAEELALRNAYFYMGECAFHLADYDRAVLFYDAAREKYSQDPASLVALAQMVTAHLKQGDTARAKAAQERAVRFYKSLPSSAWDDPTLPMTRADWERWLDASGKLAGAGESGPTREAKANTEGPAEPEGR